MPVKVNSSGGGSVTVAAASTASDFTLTLPAATGTVIYSDASNNVGIGTSSPNKSASNLALTLNAALGQYGAYELSTNNVGRWYINADATNVYDTAMNNTNRTFYTGGFERMRIDTSGNLSFNSGYGSVAVAYGCRAWVNFNGTGVVAIRASGSVSSITDNGTGNYTVNFSITLPDANYSAVTQASRDNNNGYSGFGAHGAADGQTTTSCVIYTGYESGSSSFNFDPPRVNLAVLR